MGESLGCVSVLGDGVNNYYIPIDLNTEWEC